MSEFPPSADQPSLQEIPVSPEESMEALNAVEAWLKENGDYSNYEVLDLDYTQIDPATLNSQIAASVILVQPSFGASIAFGDFSSSTKVVMAEQQSGRWEAGTRALPMGKIDVAKDLAETIRVEGLDELDEEQKKEYQKIIGSLAEQTIQRAAFREGIEETVRTPTQSETIVAGSFEDKSTGYIIHVVIDNIVATTENNTAKFEVALPDNREHSKIELVPMVNLESAEPISNGIKLTLLLAVQCIKAKNEKSNSRKTV